VADDVPEEKVVPTLRALVRKLPLHNRYLWEEVNKFLFSLSKHSAVNMMAPQNIGIVIGPNVLWQVRDKTDKIPTSSLAFLAFRSNMVTSRPSTCR
jgi:hypothetical protein